MAVIKENITQRDIVEIQFALESAKATHKAMLDTVKPLGDPNVTNYWQRQVDSVTKLLAKFEATFRVEIERDEIEGH